MSFNTSNVPVANFASLPTSGVKGVIYITENDNAMYRWDGSTYLQIGGGNTGSGGVQTAFNAAIPFDKDFSSMEHIVTGALTLTPSTTSDIDGGGTCLLLVADNTNLPDYSAFPNVTGDYDNTADVINRLFFLLHKTTTLGRNYELNISQVGTYAVPDVIAPTLVSSVIISAHVIRRTFSENVASSVSTGSTFVIEGVAGVITGQAVSGTHIDYTFSNTMTSSSTATDAYNAATGDITDTATTPNALATYSAISCTNTISGLVALSLSGSGTLSESPAGQWNSTAPNQMVTSPAKKIASGTSGRFQVEYTGVTSYVQEFGISPNNTPSGPSGFTYGWYSTNLPEIHDLPGDSTVSTSPASGDLFSLHVVDNGGGTSTITLEKSTNGGTSWTVLKTFGTTIANSDWYFKIESPSGWDGVILNPKGFNVV